MNPTEQIKKWGATLLFPHNRKKGLYVVKLNGATDNNGDPLFAIVHIHKRYTKRSAHGVDWIWRYSPGDGEITSYCMVCRPNRRYRGDQILTLTDKNEVKKYLKDLANFV